MVIFPRQAQVAQLVEQRTENPRVGGSIPSLGIEQGCVRRCSSVAERQPSKLAMRVRFPSPAAKKKLYKADKYVTYRDFLF